MKLAQYIKLNDANETGMSDCIYQQSSTQKSDNMFSDVIQENLRKFLSYLEQNQVININEIEKDRNKMSKLINEVSQVDFSNFNDQNFMNQYFSDNFQNMSSNP